MTPQLRTIMVLWGALFASTWLYMIPAYVVPHPPQPSVPLLLPALAAVSLVLVAMSAFGTRRMLLAALRNAQLGVKELANQDVERMFRDAPLKSRVFADPKSALKRAWPVYQPMFLLSMALAEAVALFGLVLVFTGFPWTSAIGFFVVCWVLMLYHFPTESKVRSALEKAYDAALQGAGP